MALFSFPASALGQIITASEPYNPVDQNQQNAVDHLSPSTTAPAIEPLDFAYLRARQAIAVGNVVAAEKQLLQIQAMGSTPGKFGDSLENIQSLIQQQNNLTEMVANGDVTYDLKAADFLVQQASSLLSYRDFETARMLVNQAKKFPVDFQKLSVSPDAVMVAMRSMQDGGVPEATNVSQVLSFMSRAQLAFDKGQFELASSLTQQAKSLGVADNHLPQNQILPWQMELKIQEAMKLDPKVVPASFQNGNNNSVIQADYDSNRDQSKTIQVAATSATTNGSSTSLPESTSMANPAMRLFESGMAAVKRNDFIGAREFLAMAWEYRNQLDAETQQVIQDQLTNLPNDAAENDGLPAPNDFATEDAEFAAIPDSPTQQDSTLSNAADELIAPGDQKLFRQLQQELFRQRAAAERLMNENPHSAIDMLVQMRTRISQSEISNEEKRPLFRIIDRDISEFQKFIDKNISTIQLQEDNESALSTVREGREKRYNTELQIQKLVDEFNALMDEERYAEADIVARQADDLAPDDEVVALMKSKAKIAINERIAMDIKERKEDSFVTSLNAVDADTIQNVTELDPMRYGPSDRWSKISRQRSDWLSNLQYGGDPAARAIWNALKSNKVEGRYQGTVSDAVNQLAEQTGINIIFDQAA
ncbi:MAG: hypothetical protein AAGA30_11015, partial [Planctomycetota bacterium]